MAGRTTAARGAKPRADGRCVVYRYTPKLGLKICERIAQGEFLSSVCSGDDMPSLKSLYRWRAKHPDFAEALAQAREMSAELRADKVLEVAEKSTSETAAADRLKIGAFQWYAEGKGTPKSSPAARRKRAAEEDDGGRERAPRKIIIEVRQFERVVGEDGRAYVRELPPLPAGPKR